MICKEFSSKYRKFFAIWPRRKRQQQQHEQWDQVRDQLQHHQQVEQHAQQAPHQARHQWRCWPRQLRGAHDTLSSHIARTLSHLMSSHTSLAQDLSLVINISIVTHVRTSLTRFSLSTSTCSSLSFPSTFCTPSCALSSTTWSSWKACATPPTRGVTTPTTSPRPSHDRVRKIQDQSSKDAKQDRNNRSLIWWMFMSSTLEALVFMGNNYSDDLHSSKNTWEDLISKQIFDIWKVDCGTNRWHFWCVSNQLGKFSMETIISGSWWRSHQSLACKGLCQILSYVLERWTRTQHQILFGKNSWNGWKTHHNTELWTQSTKNRWNSSKNIFPGIHYIGVHQQSPKVHEQNGRPRTIPRTNYLHIDVQWHHMGKNDNETECIAYSTLVSLFAKRFPAGSWSFLGPGSETKWYSTNKERPGGKWDRVAELMMIKFGESGHSVFRATSPLSWVTL